MGVLFHSTTRTCLSIDNLSTGGRTWIYSFTYLSTAYVYVTLIIRGTLPKNLILNSLNFYFILLCVCVCLCVGMYICIWVPVEARRGYDIPWSWSWAACCRFWEPNLGSLQGLITAEPFLQLFSVFFLSWDKVSLCIPGLEFIVWPGLPETFIELSASAAECCEYHHAQLLLAVLMMNKDHTHNNDCLQLSICCLQIFTDFWNSDWKTKPASWWRSLAGVRDEGKNKTPTLLDPPLPGCRSFCVFPQWPSTWRLACPSPVLNPPSGPSPREAVPSVGTEPALLQLHPVFLPFLSSSHFLSYSPSPHIATKPLCLTSYI